MPRLAWFRRRKASPNGAEKALQGSLETVTPTLLSGWVFHPSADLSEVRLVSGTRLIAVAPIAVDRPDVNAHLGRDGCFGFGLTLADDRPDPGAGDPLRLLALSADGSARFEIRLAGAAAAGTEARLRAALAPAMKGLCGHFDGLSSDGRELQGWCYGQHGSVATVWLQAEGLAPRALRCTQHRPGMAAQGHVEDCGFSLPVHEWPEAAGRSVWASFDEAGALRLPQAAPLRLAASLELETAPLAEAAALSQAALPTVVDNPALAELPVEFQAHWQALEDFRALIDGLELQVQQAEQVAYSTSLPPSPPSPPPPLRSRSARFRLWR
ncbi:MAG: hypothetical protein ACKOZW_07795 [Cyanobium sp.]